MAEDPAAVPPPASVAPSAAPANQLTRHTNASLIPPPVRAPFAVPFPVEAYTVNRFFDVAENLVGLVVIFSFVDFSDAYIIFFDLHHSPTG